MKNKIALCKIKNHCADALNLPCAWLIIAFKLARKHYFTAAQVRRLTDCGKVSLRRFDFLPSSRVQSCIHFQPIPAGLYTGGGYGVRQSGEPCSPPVKNNATLRRRYAPALFLPPVFVSPFVPHRSRCLFSPKHFPPRKKEHQLPVCAPLFVGHAGF